MHHRLLVISLGAALFALLPSCGGNSDDSTDPLGVVIAAAERTSRAGPADVDGSIVGSGAAYRLGGELDASTSYRLCARLVRAPKGLQNRKLWLEQRAGRYTTITAPLPTQGPVLDTGRACPRSSWIDDHPPTLPLYQQEGVTIPSGGLTGGEDFLHSVLLALTEMKRSAIRASRQSCGEDTCYRVRIDFRRFDRKPPGGDEDLWTLRPLFRSLGKHEVGFRVNSRGLIDRLRLAAPSLIQSDPTPSDVVVVIHLSEFGEAPAVPRVHATAIE